jgi:UDP-2-acetamido-3-amino-2,3-dideoxy-glucuronate N-acetyltransferase
MPLSQLEEITVTDLPSFVDERGSLTVAEFSRFVPFVVQRLFFIRCVPAATDRGGHAHYRCRQYLVCQNGTIKVQATDGRSTRDFLLCDGQCLLVEPGIFATETYLTSDSILLVLCDRPFEKSDYIDTIEELVRFRVGS